MGFVKNVLIWEESGVKTNKKILYFLLAFVVFITFTFSYIFIVHNAHHDCNHHQCPICMEIDAALQFLNTLHGVVLTAYYQFIALILVLAITWTSNFHVRKKETPITQKVKMLH